MQIILLKPITGRGDFGDGCTTQLTLDRGLIVEVEAGQAVQWCSIGLALAAKPAKRETTKLPAPERAVLPQPAAVKPRKRKS